MQAQPPGDGQRTIRRFSEGRGKCLFKGAAMNTSPKPFGLELYDSEGRGREGD